MNIIPNVLNNPIINTPINRPPQNIISINRHGRINRHPQNIMRVEPQMATINPEFLNNMLIANDPDELQGYVNNNYNNRIVYLRQGDPNENPVVNIYRIRCEPVLLGQISGIPGEGEVRGIRDKKKARKSNKKATKKNKKANKPNKKAIKPNKSNKKAIKPNKSNKKARKSNKKENKPNKKYNKSKRQ